MSEPGGAGVSASIRPLAAPSALPPAPLTRRLGALLYEALLLVAMALVLGFALLPLVSPAGAVDRTLTIPPPFARAMMFCALAAAGAIYYGWCWSGGRRTLPQKTWRLRIVAEDGAVVTRKTALLRYAAAWIGPVAGVIAYAALRSTGPGRYAAVLVATNYAWAFVDRDRQFLHDRIAGTRVAVEL